MLEIKNRTPFAAELVPFQDKDGVDAAAVIVKATFGWRRGGDPTVADEQLAVARSDSFYGEPGRSSVRYEADTAPRKSGTEVVLIGHAHLARAQSVDVELRAGPVRKVVRVFGDRVYYRSGSGWSVSDPAPLDRVPLTYERAFGGEDLSNPDAEHHAWCPENPVGTGLVAEETRKDIEGQRLPNIESPAVPIRGPRDRPAPAGLGFIGRSWMPRRLLAGSYDERWRRERAPLLPADFDARFHHGAPSDQLSARPFRGGERLSVTRVLASGAPLEVTVPTRRIAVAATLKGQRLDCTTSLDTLVLFSDEARLVMVWRATIPCGRDLLYIDKVEITE